jgi:uncharacterized membrane protein YbaN (DUF454 family)
MKPVVKVIRLTAGWSLIALGCIGLFVPIMPQIPFLALGALLLAPYVRIFRRLSAWLHKRYPTHRPFMRRFRDIKEQTSPATRDKGGGDGYADQPGNTP